MKLHNALYQILGRVMNELPGDCSRILEDLDTLVEIKKSSCEEWELDIYLENIRNIPSQIGLAKNGNGLTVSSRLYQNAAAVLQKVSPSCIKSMPISDGLIWLVERIDTRFDLLSPEGKTVYGAVNYIAGIGEIVQGVQKGRRWVDKDDIERGICSLNIDHSLLPEEDEILRALALARKVKEAATVEVASSNSLQQSTEPERTRPWWMSGKIAIAVCVGVLLFIRNRLDPPPSLLTSTEPRFKEIKHLEQT